MVRQHQTRNLGIPGSVRSLSLGRALRGPVGIARNDERFYAARMLLRKASISARSTSASRRSALEALSTSPAADPASAEAVETPTMLLETSAVPPAAC